MTLWSGYEIHFEVEKDVEDGRDHNTQMKQW